MGGTQAIRVGKRMTGRENIENRERALAGSVGAATTPSSFVPLGKRFRQTTDHRVSGFANGDDDYSGKSARSDRPTGRIKTRAIELQFALHDRGDIDGGEGLPENFAGKLFCGWHGSTAAASAAS